MKKGKVFLIGAGPGDPGLFTLRGREVLHSADVVAYDYLANPLLLRYTRPGADLIFVGKMGHNHTLPQPKINELMIKLAGEGKTVVRLKGGDPFVFGRGGEEAEILREAGVDFEIVPGVSSAVAVPAYAGIPVSHRDYNSTITFVTGHEDPARAQNEAEDNRIDWNGLSKVGGTLVFLMGVSYLDKIMGRLLEAGMNPETPAACVRWGTTWQQETISGTLANVAGRVKEAGFKPPATVIVGGVAALRERLRWFDLPESRPLFGKRIVITRQGEKTVEILSLLNSAGAQALDFPVTKISSLPGLREPYFSLTNLAGFDWLFFGRAEGVDFFWQNLKSAGKDSRALAGFKVGAAGTETLTALRSKGVEPDLKLTRLDSSKMGEKWAEDGVQNPRCLLVGAPEDFEGLDQVLQRAGGTAALFPAYRIEPETVEAPPGSIKAGPLAALLEEGRVNLIVFFAPLDVLHFAARMSTASEKPLSSFIYDTQAVCPDALTAAAARRLGWKVVIKLETDFENAELLVEQLAELVYLQPQVVT